MKNKLPGVGLLLALSMCGLVFAEGERESSVSLTLLGSHYKESYNPYFKCAVPSGAESETYYDCITSRYSEGYKDAYAGRRAAVSTSTARTISSEGELIVSGDATPEGLSYAAGYADGKQDRAKENL